jgi:XTP/dITP diphosphohydrolase
LSERWVFASGNPGKTREIRAMMAGCGIEIVSQAELGIGSVAETAKTFVENALIKARHAAAESGLPCLADDSGLMVDALGGQPGVLSARFAGPRANDAANVGKLLEALSGIPEGRREAQFYCVMVAVLTPDNPAPLIRCGRWRGRIALRPAGRHGFGYDPVFVDPRTGKTAAEMPPAEKNRISHRARALAALREGLSSALERGN